MTTHRRTDPGAHPDAAAIAGYATGDPGLDDVTLWSVEAHLETCGSCRAELAAGLDTGARGLLARVAVEVGRAVDAGPAPARARRTAGWRRSMAWTVVPWFLTVVGVLFAALAVEQMFPAAPSLVLMVAPVAPLLAVAAAWSRGTDPAWEIVSAAPRAGLGLLLTRALVVLVPLVPVLALVGRLSGQAPVRWLLPCLAFTAGSLALGSLIGVTRAAAVLGGGWLAGVILPSVLTARLPAVLEPGSWVGWALLTTVLALLTAARADAFRRPASRH